MNTQSFSIGRDPTTHPGYATEPFTLIEQPNDLERTASKLKEDLPLSSHVYNSLIMHARQYTSKYEYYVLKDKPESHMVLWKNKTDQMAVGIHCLEAEVPVLEDSLRRTSVIDFNKSLCFFHVPDYFLHVLQKLAKEAQGQEMMTSPANDFTIDPTRSSMCSHKQPTHTGTTHIQPTHTGTTHIQPTHTGTTHIQPTHAGTTHIQPTHTGTTHTGTTHMQPTHTGTTHTGTTHMQPTHATPFTQTTPFAHATPPSTTGFTQPFGQTTHHTQSAPFAQTTLQTHDTPYAQTTAPHMQTTSLPHTAHFTQPTQLTQTYDSSQPLMCPAGFRVYRMGKAGVEHMLNSWRYKQSVPVEDILELSKNVPTAGVYEEPEQTEAYVVDTNSIPMASDDRVPVSWVSANTHGPMGMQMTEESHKGRGFAQLLSEVCAKMMESLGFFPHTTVEEDIPSLGKFYENLPGWARTRRVTKCWQTVTKEERIFKKEH